MAKYNPFDPANGYSEEDRLALNGKCASLINQAYKNPFPGTKIRLDGADNAGIFFAKQLAHVKTKAYDKDFPELSGLKIFPQTSETDEGAAYIVRQKLLRMRRKIVQRPARPLPRHRRIC